MIKDFAFLSALLFLAGQAPAEPVAGRVIGTNRGLVTLQPGSLLRGISTHRDGSPAADVGIYIRDAVTDSTVAPCDDDTNGSGSGSVIVAIATLNITCTQRCTGFSVRETRLDNVLGTGNPTSNAALPAGPCGKPRQNSRTGSVAGPASGGSLP
jgi:hypothetical protein